LVHQLGITPPRLRPALLGRRHGRRPPRLTQVHRGSRQFPHATHARQTIAPLRGARAGLAHSLGLRRGKGRFASSLWHRSSRSSLFIVISPTLARSRWISSSRSSASRLFKAVWPPARNASRHCASVAAVTPSSRARLSRDSPRNRRRIVSVFRRAEKRPGSRPLSAGPLAAAVAPPLN